MSKVIVVTGASSGFGKLAVEMLVAQGHTVIAGLRGGQARMEQIFDSDLRNTGRLHAVDLHVEKPETHAGLVHLIRDQFQGHLDVLVNNAGFGRMGAVENQNLESIREQFEVNTFAPIILSRLLLPYLRSTKGRILNISSLVGRQTFPFYGAYAASKHALEALSESMAYELSSFDVQVCLIEPGSFRTEFVKRALVEADPGESQALYAGMVRRFNSMIQSKGKLGGDARHVANLIVHYATRPKIPIRRPIGFDAHVLIFLRRLLPESIRYWLIRLTFSQVLRR